MTRGERRVGVDFNPDGNPLVDAIKRKAAELIDLVNRIETTGYREPNEVARLKALAMTDAEAAAMWGVKAVTRDRR